MLDALRGSSLVAHTGHVRRIQPTLIEADGPSAPLGALCVIEANAGPAAQRSEVLAEVVAVKPDSIVLAPFEESAPMVVGARVRLQSLSGAVAVGDDFLGRAVDALGRPIDGLPAPPRPAKVALKAPAPAALDRRSTDAVLVTGVRAIDGLLTLGHGQRIGVFAASGVGKTSLMAQLINQVEADRCVIALIGERGREVEALWRKDLPNSARARSALVAATSDQSAAMRVRAADYALALAEHWRTEGRHVLLVMDSVSRLAMAMREIGLAAGEPPTVRAYTPGVFAAVPKLVERCGALRGGGTITAIMTVLSETDDVDDPISEMMKSLLDGHIILSRDLAEQRHFPAIDVPRSVSRLSEALMGAEHAAHARRAVAALSAYAASRTLIDAGVYTAGSNPEIDRSIALHSPLSAFLQQARQEHTPFEHCRRTLAELMAELG